MSLIPCQMSPSRSKFLYPCSNAPLQRWFAGRLEEVKVKGQTPSSTARFKEHREVQRFSRAETPQEEFATRRTFLTSITHDLRTTSRNKACVRCL